MHPIRLIDTNLERFLILILASANEKMICLGN